MCICPDSPWVNRARDYLQANQDNRDLLYESIEILLNNGHCGRANAAPEEVIYNQLNINRERFQQTVLGELKRMGIVSTLIHPNGVGNRGIFIPCNEDDIASAALQVFRRAESLMNNLAGSATGTRIENLARDIADQIEQAREQIQ